MRLPILKCHGSGNDFPLIDARTIDLDDAAWSRIARTLADRAGPVGGDGLLLLTPGDEIHAFGMEMVNSDGSTAEMCLNGLRCVARAGFDALGIDRALVRTRAGGVTAEHGPDIAPGVYTVREVAGPVSLDVTAWPLLGVGRELVQQPIPMLPTDRRFTAVAIGNPHLIAFVDEVDEAELVAVGQICEAAPEWLPNRANVSFVERRGPDLFVRTFERGVGLTDSCGSAMATSTFAACLTERAAFGQALTVFNKGGLVRGLAHNDGMVELSGNATWMWRGSIEIDPDSGIAVDLTIDERFDDEQSAWTQAAA